jgi:hypothetical protein
LYRLVLRAVQPCDSERVVVDVFLGCCEDIVWAWDMAVMNAVLRTYGSGRYWVDKDGAVNEAVYVLVIEIVY